MCAVVISGKQTALKSNHLNYRVLWSYPQATLPPANQLQQIAAVNISELTDLNKGGHDFLNLMRGPQIIS